MKATPKKQRKMRNPAIRVGDKVQVIAGKNKDETGKVLDVDWKRERVLVEGINFVLRHTKPNQQNQQGGIFKSEAPIHYSNVLLYSSELGKGVRVRVERTESGEKKRICSKTSNIIE